MSEAFPFSTEFPQPAIADLRAESIPFALPSNSGAAGGCPGAEAISTRSVAAPRTEKVLPAPEEIASELCSDIRPTPHRIAELIGQGLTEEKLIAAVRAKGLRVPAMELTLADLDALLPHLVHISDTLAAKLEDAMLLCADRDADLLNDVFCVRHPEKQCRLLPASGPLWWSESMDSPVLVAKFLEAYGVSRERVEDPSQRFVLADAGFKGSIGMFLDDKVLELYGRSLVGEGRLDIELVCAHRDARGRQILDIPDEAIGPMPKIKSWMGEAMRDYLKRGFSTTHKLAIAMNLMPRRHGAFDRLAEIGGSVVALPRDLAATSGSLKRLKYYSQTVDRCPYGLPDHNASIINAVAAAIVQFRTVKYAIESRQLSGRLA